MTEHKKRITPPEDPLWIKDWKTAFPDILLLAELPTKKIL